MALKPNMLIIICTGFRHALTPEKAQQLGMPRLLHKPLFIQDLEAALEDVLPQKV